MMNGQKTGGRCPQLLSYTYIAVLDHVDDDDGDRLKKTPRQCAFEVLCQVRAGEEITGIYPWFMHRQRSIDGHGMDSQIETTTW